jgi:hypothetical protein
MLGAYNISIARNMMSASELEGTLGLDAGLHKAARQEIALAQPGAAHGMAIQRFHRGRLRHSLLQQGQRLGQTPSQGIGVPQAGEVHGEPVTDAPLLAECQALFEPGDSPQFDVLILDKWLLLGDQLLDVEGKPNGPELTTRTLSRTERIRV